jgi:hypothetical protein
MKRIVSILALAALATLAVLAPVSGHLVPAVHASSGCTVAKLNGTYAFNFNGTLARSATSRPFPRMTLEWLRSMEREI